MNNKTKNKKENQKSKKATAKATISLHNRCGYMSQKKLKELDDDIYETTRVTIDNFIFSDDL